ncbi:nucleic acid/nucleotide deaminase domain-containing protein [Streptomyces sp. NPDC052040]|uniref:nucleic acid/nucleotide deaminase domain-containing protein n=1 Tax=Streptomyces sp. NPDC052040 TaxID=3365682 RepID=UPI0037D7EADF
MTSSGERLAVRFGETGVRRFEGRHTVPTMPEAAVLARIGALTLPLRVNPYFHTLREEPASLREYAESIGKDLDAPGHLSWARLGSDRAFELCVTPEGTVRGILIGYDEPERFVNSTPEAFADGLLELDALLEAIAATDDPEEAATTFHATERALRAADPQAFADPENWWPLVLEDIRTTSSVEVYATFEFVAPDGDRHRVTESGSICVHPEERTWSAMYAAGIEPEQITRIHTELQACFMPGHYCALWLQLMFPDASLTHNVAYGDTAAERASGIRRLREAVAKPTGADRP